MTLFRIRIRPLSPWRSLGQADTLAGLLCWTCARTEGDEVLERDILGPSRAGHPPFVLSDLFPGDLLPLPRFALHEAERLNPAPPKSTRRSPLVTRSAFLDLQRGGALSADAIASPEPLRRSVQIRNVLNRVNDATTEGGGLFAQAEYELARPLDHLSLYVRAEPAFAERILGWLRALGDTGFGADASVGKGQFEILGGLEPDAELDAVRAADGFVVLSTFQPAATDPTDGEWSVFTKHGKLGPDFGVSDVFKRPLVMLRPGASFRSSGESPLVGRLIRQSELLSPGTDAELSGRGIGIAQLAFGLAVPARWPVDHHIPASLAPTLTVDGGALAVVMLIDLEGTAHADDLLALLPGGAPRQILRLGDFGATRIVRTGPRPENLDWPTLQKAVFRLVTAAREAAGDRRAHFFIHGLAPLPVFSYLGLLLSAWASVTVVNRRKDGGLDVCPLSGRRTDGELFDAVSGLDPQAAIARPGRVIVFVSTGHLPEIEKLERFVQSGGDAVAGLVQIRTSSQRIIDRTNSVAMADELARHLSMIPSVYPLQKGIVLVVAGPAQLAVAAGRAVNPTIITDVWIANRGGGGPSGHELAVAVSSSIERRGAEPASAADGAPADAPRPRIEELRLFGFKAFENARLQFDEFTAIIGRNGAGKSTLIEAISFLRDAVTDSLHNALIQRGGLANLACRLTDSASKGAVGLGIVVSWPDEAPGMPDSDDGDYAEAGSPTTSAEPAARHRAFYGFRLTTGFDRGGIEIEEVLDTGASGRHFRRRAGDQVETNEESLRQLRPPKDTLLLPLVAGVVPEWQRVLDAIGRLRAYTLSVARLRTPSAAGGGRRGLDKDGGNAAATLIDLAPEAIDKQWVVDHLAAITPGIVGVDVVQDLGGRQRVIYFDQRPDEGRADSSLSFHADAMSDGTMRALGILLALRQRPSPSLVLIDELEDSLHHGALDVLLDAIEATLEDRCQVAITSHSTDVLSHRLVTPDRTRFIVWRNGRSRVHRLDEGSTRNATTFPDTVGSLLRVNGVYPDDEPALFEDFFAWE